MSFSTAIFDLIISAWLIFLRWCDIMALVGIPWTSPDLDNPTDQWKGAVPCLTGIISTPCSLDSLFNWLPLTLTEPVG